MNVKEVLTESLTKLEHGFIKGHLHQRRNGVDMYCTRGAIFSTVAGVDHIGWTELKAIKSDQLAVVYLAEMELEAAIPEYRGLVRPSREMLSTRIVAYNNAPETTLAEIKAMFARAIDRLEAESRRENQFSDPVLVSVVREPIEA